MRRRAACVCIECACVCLNAISMLCTSIALHTPHTADAPDAVVRPHAAAVAFFAVRSYAAADYTDRGVLALLQCNRDYIRKQNGG